MCITLSGLSIDGRRRGPGRENLGVSSDPEVCEKSRLVSLSAASSDDSSLNSSFDSSTKDDVDVEKDVERPNAEFWNDKDPAVADAIPLIGTEGAEAAIDDAANDVEAPPALRDNSRVECMCE